MMEHVPGTPLRAGKAGSAWADVGRRFDRWRDRLLGPPLGAVVGVRTTERVAALTFDDGPHPEWTPRLLDVLALHDAKATFFLVGKMARRYPALVDRIARAGHAIGNHSWSHPSLPSVSGREVVRQIERCEAVIGDRGPKLFRPPFGDLDWATAAQVRARGYTIVCWSGSGVDWEPHDRDWICEKLRGELRPGAILLLHDQLFAYSRDDEPARDETFAAVDRLLSGARDYAFVTVPELIARGKPQRRVWLKESDAEAIDGMRSYENLGYRRRRRP